MNNPDSEPPPISEQKMDALFTRSTQKWEFEDTLELKKSILYHPKYDATINQIIESEDLPQIGKYAEQYFPKGFSQECEACEENFALSSKNTPSQLRSKKKQPLTKRCGG
jgi:hypothetical protein